MADLMAPPVGSTPVATQGLNNRDWQQFDYGPAKVMTSQAGQPNPAATNMQEVTGEQPKRKYTALKIATGLAALATTIYLGAKYGAPKLGDKYGGKAIKSLSETIVNKTRDFGNWVKNLFKRGVKETPNTPASTTSQPPAA